MKSIIIVGLGSFLGGIARYLIALLFNLKVLHTFPYGSFTVNIVGCFLIGIVYSLSHKFNLSLEWKLFLTTGLLGGFTTFSAFSIESFELLKNQHFLTAFLYVSLSISMGLSASVLGAYVFK